MTAFATFGINHLSPSSLTKWSGDRGAWVASYILGLKDEMGPPVWRGKAVEAGLEAALRRPDIDPLPHAVQQFEMEAGGLADDATEAERANIRPMLELAREAIKGFGAGDLIASQLRIEHYIDGIEIPFIGYPDFIFDGVCVDLKTTLRCPSSIRPDHAMQIAFYAHARGEDRAQILYVTPKKTQAFTMTALEISEALRDLKRRARSLQSTLYAAGAAAHHSERTAREVLTEMCAPDFSHFYWSNEAMRQQAAAIPAWS